MKMGCLEVFDFPAPLTCHHFFLFFLFFFFLFQLSSFCCFAHVNISPGPAGSQLSLLPLLGPFPRPCLAPCLPHPAPALPTLLSEVCSRDLALGPHPCCAGRVLRLPWVLQGKGRQPFSPRAPVWLRWSPLRAASSGGVATPRSLLVQISNPCPRAPGQRRISMRMAVWYGRN